MAWAQWIVHVHHHVDAAETGPTYSLHTQQITGQKYSSYLVLIVVTVLVLIEVYALGQMDKIPSSFDYATWIA